MAHVLVVEDDFDIMNMIANVLRKHGHTATTADSGFEALSAIDRLGAPDVAVLDVMMPGMSGFNLVQRLREHDRTAQLPVVFLSARVQAEDIAAGERLGAIYMTKPFKAKDLTAAVDRALAG